ncbi:MAG: hypothetical protein ABGZ17_19380, partial [Planctomycetaceae bacterium]
MHQILVGYVVNDQTWFYHSLLLVIAVYFKFGRLWSLRNLDLVLLLAMSPGLLLYQTHRPLAYTWLLTGTVCLMVRLLLDDWFERRPHLEQNLNTSGLTFLCVASFAFLTANAWNEPLDADSVAPIRRSYELINRQDTTHHGTAQAKSTGPTPSLVVSPLIPIGEAVRDTNMTAAEVTARLLAILSHLAVVIGLIVLSKWHFGDLHIGLGMATCYLLLPCTAYDVQKVAYVLPAALVVWAIAAYRRPLVSGTLLGLACGTLLFPVFLLPLWVAFYGRQGRWRFLAALVSVAGILLGTFALTSTNVSSFSQQTIGALDLKIFDFRSWHPDFGDGIWNESNFAYRIPVFSLYVLLVFGLTVWPRRKHLEVLIAHSAAIVVGTQFWYPRQGGAYMLWYIPIVLLVVFRPRLAHRAASTEFEVPGRNGATESAAETSGRGVGQG